MTIRVATAVTMSFADRPYCRPRAGGRASGPRLAELISMCPTGTAVYEDFPGEVAGSDAGASVVSRLEVVQIRQLY